MKAELIERNRNNPQDKDLTIAEWVGIYNKLIPAGNIKTGIKGEIQFILPSQYSKEVAEQVVDGIIKGLKPIQRRNLLGSLIELKLKGGNLIGRK